MARPGARRWPVRRPARPPLEKVEQAQIVRFLTGIGGRVCVSGTRRSRGKACRSCGAFVPEDQGTRQTPGIPDLEAYLPPPPSRRPIGDTSRVLLKVECKRTGETMRPEQAAYAELARAAGVHHVAGDLNAVLAWATAQGYIHESNVPHYRRASLEVPA